MVLRYDPSVLATSHVGRILKARSGDDPVGIVGVKLSGAVQCK